jgi:hypothetical protein
MCRRQVWWSREAPRVDLAYAGTDAVTGEDEAEVGCAAAEQQKPHISMEKSSINRTM